MRADCSRLAGILGINRRNVEVIHRYNPRHGFPAVDDKIRTKELLGRSGVRTPRTLRVVDSFLEIRRTLEALRREPSFVVKPARGRAGGGVLLLERKGAGWASPSGRAVSPEELAKHLGDILFGVYSFGRMDDRGLVEEKVEQHPFFGGIYAGGIADIRLILLDAVPLMAMARVPTRASNGKANLHQGAIGVSLEVESGRTGAGSWRGKALERHPDSGAPLAGRTVPDWPLVLEQAMGSARAVPLRYVGVDIVLDRSQGPLVLEVNARPGLQIQVINARGLAGALAAAAGEAEP